MKKSLLTFIVIIHTTLGFSQFFDDFSDSNFSINPIWTGDTSVFEIDSTLQLHLKDTLSNTSYLSTPSKAILNAVWEFKVYLDFNPSTSNYAQVYLASDKNDLTNSLNGVFVRIGGESGNIDDVSLFVQHGSSSTKIINGTDGIAANKPDIKIKVSRDSLGNWKLFTDTSGTYILEGTAFDNTNTQTDYFGVYCKYTSTRANKFWFDNFKITGSYDTTSQRTNRNDVVINEIYADPNPSIGLPEYEYIELYNTTKNAINLTGWTVNIGTSKKQLPYAIIEADSFILLTKEEALALFPNNISKVGLSSVTITNAGTDIILKDKNNTVINALSFTDNWYKDENKKDGGWAIEQINPNLFCEEHNNWGASIATIGGTPGKQNAIAFQNSYSEPLRILQVYPSETNTLHIHFNKPLDSLTLVNLNNYSLPTALGKLSTIKINDVFNKQVQITFEHPLIEKEIYHLAITTPISDCNNNTINTQITYPFAIAKTALPGDIAINEILFNPKDNGVDYVELYNNSNHFINLANYRLANFFVFGTTINADNWKIITDDIFILKPKEYLILTTDSAKVKMQYATNNPYSFIEMESMPTFANDAGTVCLVHQSLNTIIDAFSYTETLHFSLLDAVEGVALERLNPSDSTQKSSNWHSAASTVGYGTPTYKNSQHYIQEPIGELRLNPKIISPNNDGYQDILHLNWSFKTPELKATIKVFDAEGRLINTLLNNQLIGNNGSITWDGTNTDGFVPSTGIYILWMEVFSTNGELTQFKEIVVLNK